MRDDAIPSDARLPDILAARAHGASTRRLRLDVLGGLLAAVVAVAWRPQGWYVFVGAGLCFAAFGGWGLLDRALATHDIPDRSPTRRALVVGRGALAVVGGGAAAVVVFGVLLLTLGTWIS